MRAELRSRARTFARALDMPAEWETDRLALDMATWSEPLDHIKPSMDHTIIRRKPQRYGFEPMKRERLVTPYPLDPPEYRPA